MFSDWKQTVYGVKDEIQKQKYLTAACLLWFILCTWWGTWNNFEINEFYGYETCTADLLIGQQGGTYVGLTIFPFAAFLFMKCKRNSLNVQYLLRYGSRGRMFRRQIMESSVYALGMSVFLLLIQILFSSVKCSSLINWEKEESYYCMLAGVPAEGNFFLVLGAVFLMYLVKFMIVLTFLDILLWYPRYLFILWVLLVAAAGAAWLAELDLLYELFGFWWKEWTQPVQYGGQVLIGVLIISVEYLTGIGLIREKDVFQ